jgi:acyl-homoserine lactone acylase PvdQ
MPAPAWTGANEWAGWRRPAEATAESPLASLARRHPARADALLRALRDLPNGPAWPNAARALVVNTLADALRDEGPPSSPVLFTHPLAISDATRRRFDVGPIRPAAPSDRFVLVAPNKTDWDLSTAMNAPGQSGSPSSAHYADLAHLWAEGQTITLPFTDRAVAAAAESTLLLTPQRASRP